MTRVRTPVVTSVKAWTVMTPVASFQKTMSNEVVIRV